MRVATALLDANVLYSKTLRDWICLLALEEPGLFQPVWTESILNEWQYRLRRNEPVKPEDWITQYRHQLEASFPHSLIQGFHVEQPAWMDDPHDAHVHSAAVAGGVEYLITADSGWSAAPLDFLPYEVHSPDSFLRLCAESAPEAMRRRVAGQLAYTWKRRKGEGVNIIEPLKRAGANVFAEWVRSACQHASVTREFDLLVSEG